MMEGLACPRGTKSPETSGLSRGSLPGHGEKKVGPGPVGGAGGGKEGLPGYLPQVEGLAARFDAYFDKEKAARQGTSLEGFAGRFASPDVQSASSRPTSAGSKSSVHTPDIPDGQVRNPSNCKIK